MMNPQTYDPQTYDREESRFPWGCVFGGCAGVVFFCLAAIVVLGLSSYWFYKGQIAKYTSGQPANIPVVEFDETQVTELEERVETFQAEVEAGSLAEVFVLSEEELNALITQQDEMKGRIYVDIETDQITAEVSVPVDMIPGAEGRFFNGEVTFDIAIEDGELVILLTDARVQGEPVPEVVLGELRKQNLAEDIGLDPETKKILSQFQSIELRKDQIVLTPSGKKVAAGDAAAESAEVSTEFDEPDRMSDETSTEGKPEPSGT